MNIFEKRTAYKPFEYPEILQFTEAINQTYWVHTEVNFDADVQEFNTVLNDKERSAITNALKAIAQVEVAVKTYWGNLYNHLPKPEFNGLGSTFAECEFRHSEAYSRLLDVIGVTDFEEFIQDPAISDRLSKLGEYISLGKAYTPREFAISMATFALLVENVSLFSQFAIVLSFTRFQGIMKNVANQIAWTSKDENVHAKAGIYIFNKVVEENPEIFDEDLKATIREVAHLSMETETRILDKIFEKGELDSIPKNRLVEFMKQRVNESFEEINLPALFEVDSEEVKQMRWFEEEVFGNSQDDFFAKRVVDYSKHDTAFSEDDLF
ncbi:ribonucleotide-diphosphate reductase subunit beta [Sediminitomix flava]|uniref:ribonucleoside-diphosphate reductase n=1 Tax=Sediminitomix flava TaxID=379075 RepID=A0A315Z5N6_SEDFL|nr:ribonucleotide-diphosphate reductase subunit beta [Sediminitomix flava]PWJ39213.1 ribonucleoside-diphosphate reductase beta chain [Sediminitomix flava]